SAQNFQPLRWAQTSSRNRTGRHLGLPLQLVWYCLQMNPEGLVSPTGTTAVSPVPLSKSPPTGAPWAKGVDALHTPPKRPYGAADGLPAENATRLFANIPARSNPVAETGQNPAKSHPAEHVRYYTASCPGA